MATKHQITQEILDARNTAQDVVRRNYLSELSGEVYVEGKRFSKLLKN